MPFANVNKCSFYYEMMGEGDPLVFIHGETHGTLLFEKQMPYFSRNRRCFTYDRRGHGKSQLAEYGYSLWHQVEDLKCLLDFVEIDRAVVVAVAMATPLGATFALQYPDRVKGLVLCSWYEMDGFPVLEERRKAYQMSFADVHIKMRDILLERGRTGLESFLEENHRTALQIFPPDKPDVRRKLVELFASHLPDKYVKSAEYYTSIPNVRAQMHGVKCPVLGICGTDDPSPDNPDLLKHLSKFRQAWIPGARRFTMMEYPDHFNAVLEGFLAELA